MAKHSPHSPRRSFIKKLAAGVAATSLAPIATRAQGGHHTSGSKLGIALVGLGNYSRGELAPALQETKLCELKGIVTGTKEKEKIWADKYGIESSHIYNYETFDSIADDPAIDVVYVVLPNSMHKEYVIRAAKAGKHVITEKPMGLDAEECREMITACDQTGVKLSVGYRLRFEPNTLVIEKTGREQLMGPVRYVQSEMGFRIGNPKQWRLRRALAGGGAMMDVGIYAIQGARYSTSEEPIAVRAQEFKTDRVKFAEVDETVTWQMEFPSGVISNSTTSYNFKLNELTVSYDKGRAGLLPAYSYRGVGGHVGNTVLKPAPINQQALQMDDFARCVIQDETSIVSGEEGLRDAIVIDAIYESLRRGGARVEI